MTDATGLQILICIFSGWKRTGMIIIAHTQNNMSQCNGACFHNGAISSDQCFRTNSNDDDSYCRCFTPSVQISSKDLGRLGNISNGGVIHFRTFSNWNIFWCSLTDASARVREYFPFFIPLFMDGSPQNNHLPTVSIFWYIKIKEYAVHSNFLQIVHCVTRASDPKFKAVSCPLLSSFTAHVSCLFGHRRRGGASVDDLINEYLEQMKRKDRVDGEVIHGTYVKACVLNVGGYQ